MEGGIIRGARMQVTSARKPLLSVADVNDARQDVSFLASGKSYTVQRKFIRNKGVFEIDAEVPPCGLGFQKHPAKG